MQRRRAAPVRTRVLRVRTNFCNETMSGCTMFQETGMEKENSASGGGGGGGGGEAAALTPGATSTSEKLQADQANPLLDPTALFGGKSFSLVSLPSFFWKGVSLAFLSFPLVPTVKLYANAPRRDKRHYARRRR